MKFINAALFALAASTTSVAAFAPAGKFEKSFYFRSRLIFSGI